ncbi:MAG: hypothetical protein WD877_00940 [Candidatus Saccharimonadales bacterium]
MTRVLLIVCLLGVLALPATALADDGEMPPPCDNTIPGNVCPQGPPPEIIVKLSGRLPVGGWKIRQTRIDPLYSQVASTISGVSNAQVRCWSEADWAFLGPYFGSPYAFVLTVAVSQFWNGDITGIPDDKAHFSPEICAQLDLMTYGHKRPRVLNTKVLMANALNALAHEPWHIAGVMDEMVAQCYALQSIEQVGIMIGLPRVYAHEMGQVAWKYIQTTAPLFYQNPRACRDGGPLDRNTGLGWPS